VAEDTDGDENPTQDEEDVKQTTPQNNARHIGLGLAVLARYVKATGGQIRGRSTPGVGTTFTVEVPLENAIDQRRSESMSEDFSDSEVDFTTPRSTLASIDTTRRPGLTKKFSSSPDISVRYNGGSGSSYRPPRQSRMSREASYESTGSQVGRLDLGGRLRIIVADDNSVNCAILMRRLNKAGHDVKLCRDGQQCVEAFQQDRTGYNFILMDINVSGLSFLSLHLPFRVSALLYHMSDSTCLLISSFQGHQIRLMTV
jgi:CheY-like chemotaxis protein